MAKKPQAHEPVQSKELGPGHLIALVRLLARQAARDVITEAISKLSSVAGPGASKDPRGPSTSSSEADRGSS